MVFSIIKQNKSIFKRFSSSKPTVIFPNLKILAHKKEKSQKFMSLLAILWYVSQVSEGGTGLSTLPAGKQIFRLIRFGQL